MATQLAEPTTTSHPVLSIRNVSKSFPAKDGSESQALVDVSFDAARGEFIAIVGPSGCGKTTLLKMCTGLVSRSSGDIDYDGTGAPVVAGDFGMVFQTATLLPWQSVRDNVMLPARVLGLDKRASHERADYLLNLVGLGEAGKKLPNELSGGMQQRASIARALLHDPPILFMDEPFGALDAITRDEMTAELQRIHMAQEKTVLFVTHSIQEAVLLADRIIVLATRPGRISADITVDFPRPRTMETTLTPEFRSLATHIYQLIEGNGAP